MNPLILLFLFLFALPGLIVVILAKVEPRVCTNRIFLEVAFRSCAISVLIWCIGAFATISFIPSDFVSLGVATFFGFQTVRFYKKAKQMKFLSLNV